MSSLAGETIMFAGSLKMGLSAAQKQAKEAGAKVVTVMNENTTVAVFGSDSGEVLSTAAALGVKILTESDFVDLVEGATQSDNESDEPPAPTAPKASLAGKTIVFTGTMDTKRGTATAMATTAGAKVTSSVSGNTDILVAGAAAGSKLDAAKAKGITIMTEGEFLSACSGGGGASKHAADNEATGAAKKKLKTEGSFSLDDGDTIAGTLEALKAAVLARKEHLGFYTEEEDIMFMRDFKCSALGFLRGSAPREDAGDDVDPAFAESTRDDETAADTAGGAARWGRLLKALKNADKLTELFDEAFIEDNMAFLSEGEVLPFAFCVPPSTTAAWDLNKVLFAACHNEDGDNEGDEEDADSGILGDEDDRMELQGKVANTFIPKAIEKKKEDEDENEGDEEDEESGDDDDDTRTQWLEKAKALPFFNQLLWANHEWNYCDESNPLVMYVEDHAAGIVWGTWIKRSW